MPMTFQNFFLLLQSQLTRKSGHSKKIHPPKKLFQSILLLTCLSPKFVLIANPCPSCSLVSFFRSFTIIECWRGDALHMMRRARAWQMAVWRSITYVMSQLLFLFSSYLITASFLTRFCFLRPPGLRHSPKPIVQINVRLTIFKACFLPLKRLGFC